MFPHNIQASTKTDMNVLEVIDHKSLGGDDLSTHYAGENEPQPGHCHDGPGHGLELRVLSGKVYAMGCHFQKAFACDR